MKRTSLFSIALFLSVTLFAQTSVKNSNAVKNKTSVESAKGSGQVNSSTTTSSSTSLQSDAANGVKSKADAEIQKEKKRSVASSNKAEAQARTTTEESKKVASKEVSASSSVALSADADISAKDNNIKGNSSIVNNTTITASGEKSKQTVRSGETAVMVKADGTADYAQNLVKDAKISTRKVAKQVRSTSYTSVQAGASSATTIKPKPVSVKTSTLLKTKGAIKLR